MAVKKNKFAFWPELIGKNELTDVGLDEVSIVHPPANQHSRVVMMKSLAFNFTPLGFAKAGLADPSWPDESPIDDATNPDMNFTGRVTQKKRAKQVKKMVAKMVRKAARDFSDGQSGGHSFSESDRVGAQDARSPDEVADDALEIARTIEANPPTAQERRWSDYAARVFGDAVKDFTSAELAQAKAVFEAIRNNVLLQKSAGDALNQAAFALKLARPELSTYQAFAKAAREHPELYAASRGIAKDNPVLTGTIANGAIDQFESPRQRKRTVRKDQCADSTMNAGDPNVDDLSPEECNALIQREAQRIRQEFGTSATNALIMAAQRHPGAHMKSKDCPLG